MLQESSNENEAPNIPWVVRRCFTAAMPMSVKCVNRTATRETRIHCAMSNMCEPLLEHRSKGGANSDIHEKDKVGMVRAFEKKR